MQENRIKEIIEIAEGVNREECSLSIRYRRKAGQRSGTEEAKYLADGWAK